MTRTLGAALLAICAASPMAAAYRAGAPAGRTGSPDSLGGTCRQCHGSATGGGAVQIIGAPERYRPNVAYDLTIRVSDPVQAGAGFEISVELPDRTHVGTLLIIDPDHTRYAGGFPAENWVTHSWFGVQRAVDEWAAHGSSAEYVLRWVAPSEDVGELTFYVAGNAINNSFTHSGDIIYTTTASATAEVCAADLDGDGQVGSPDLALLLGGWGGGGAADLDLDGAVDSADLALLLGSWGACA